MMITKVRGRFEKFDVKLEIGETPEQSSVEATIDIASVTTDIQQRDDHLRSADFFDAANSPTMTFKGTSFTAGKGDLWQLTGDLTIRGATHPVTLEVEFGGAGQTPGVARGRRSRLRPRSTARHGASPTTRRSRPAAGWSARRSRSRSRSRRRRPDAGS